MNDSIDNKQKAHYETIHDDYSNHYYDKESLAYGKKFILGENYLVIVRKS